MSIQSLNDLLVHELQDLYDAEHQLLKAIPKMASAASARDLKAALNEHLEQTHAQIQRLEQVFEALGQRAARKTCKAMKGLIEEGDETLKEEMPKEVKDAALIAAAQRIEHYEMAGYGTARTFAYQLGSEQAARLLQQTLEEEEMTDKKLTMVASKVNEKANT